jgi:hypothetical protein
MKVRDRQRQGPKPARPPGALIRRYESEMAALWSALERGENPALAAVELGGELLVRYRALVVASERLMVAMGRRG